MNDPTGAGEATARRTRSPERRNWGVIGAFVCLMWIVVFAAGMLEDSCRYRYWLAPNLVRTCCASAPTSTDRSTAAAPPGSDGACVGDPLPRWFCLAMAILLYTPLNVALLAILAGCVGGCSSVASYGMGDAPPEATSGHSRERQQGFFLKEHPLASTLRGFFVYLAILGGLYTAVGNPFPTDVAPSQAVASYAHLAGLVSFLAFLVGYDPTRIAAFLDLLPGRSGKTD